jgi:uncharacterized protein (TIGR02001 family)
MIEFRGFLGVGGAAVGMALLAMAAPAQADDMFDVAFGVTGTSDYLSRGVSQTEHKAAIQGYIEPSAGALYAGVWASNVSFDGTPDTEIDFYAGYRPEIGPVTLDFGYNRATYASGSDPSGEFYIKADVAADDNTTLGAQFYLNPDDSSTYVEANADISLPHGFGVSGAIGAVSNDYQPYTTWNAGIYYSPFEWAKVDVRYSATNLDSAGCMNFLGGGSGNECDSRIVVGLSIDTSLSALKAK